MTRKVYRTAQGKLVDLGRLQLQNENTRAVGNMGVNARGDKVDSLNRPIDKKPAQVQRQYNRQTAPTAETAPVRAKPKAKPPAEIPAPPEDFNDDFERPQDAAPAPTSGLAAAIARAREIKQEPLRSAADTARHQEGVTKL
jgi:cell division protein FtsN